MENNSQGPKQFPAGRKSPQFRMILHDEAELRYEDAEEILMQVLGVEHPQAEQLTLLVHYKGWASIKEGPYAALLLLQNQLAKFGLATTLEKR